MKIIKKHKLVNGVDDKKRTKAEKPNVTIPLKSMIEKYERKLGAMTHQFLKKAGALIQEARDLETIYFQVHVRRRRGWI